MLAQLVLVFSWVFVWDSGFNVGFELKIGKLLEIVGLLRISWRGPNFSNPIVQKKYMNALEILFLKVKLLFLLWQYFLQIIWLQFMNNNDIKDYNESFQRMCFSCRRKLR